MSIETLLALWGAALSTGLASLRIWEIHRARPRLTLSYHLSDPRHGGNEIVIENASTTPVMISYWELLLQKRGFPRCETVTGRLPDEGGCKITVGAHSRHTLHFKDESYFSWGVSKLRGGVWYLKLFVVGKMRPVWLKVYPTR